MAVTGFAGQAARNRRETMLFLALYGATFFTFALLIFAVVPVILGNASRSVFVDPLAYVADYWAICLAFPFAIMAWTSHTFRREISETLRIREVDSRAEPRFAQVAEAQAILQGLRCPRLGIIETPARNAITVGALGGRPTLAVTRGLLEALDDDELAAVLAHEIAHWRVGDVRMLTVNQLLLRTAMTLQANNPIRIEKHPHQKVPFYLVLGVLLPIWLIVLFVGGLITISMWRLARFANGRVRAGRDSIADGEAVRMTHFPEALETAIAKCAGRGWFENAQRVEALLFDGATVGEGGTHPDQAERIAELRRHASPLYSEGRLRRDTRTAAPALAPASARGSFGRRGLGAPSGFAVANAARPELEQWTVKRGMTFWTDPESHRKWRRDLLDWFTWKADDDRDWFGIAPDMRVWAYGSLAASLVIGIAISPTVDDYIGYATGRGYWEKSDAAFENLTCSFGNSVDECNRRMDEKIALAE